jgi:ribosome-associated protein
MWSSEMTRPTMKKTDFRKAALLAAEAAFEKKAEGVLVLDIRKESDVADYVVVAGADSTVQMKAMRSSIADALAAKGLRPLHQDGQAAGRWLVMDYGALIVHLLLPEARRFYRLESLWEKAKAVPLKTK